VGSGIIVVPALVFLLAFPQKSAQGTALAVMVPMALMGALRYWINPHIQMDWRVVLLVAVGAVCGALMGSKIAGRLPGPTLRRVFAVFVLIVGVRMFFFRGTCRSSRLLRVKTRPPERRNPDLRPAGRNQTGDSRFVAFGTCMPAA